MTIPDFQLGNLDSLDSFPPINHTRLRYQSSICLNYGKFVSSGGRVHISVSFERGVQGAGKIGPRFHCN